MSDYPIFTYIKWVCAVKDWLPMIERERIMVVVKNIKTQLFLVIQYKSNDEISFVSGGIEKWDSKRDTVIKELKEESGISSLPSISESVADYFEVKFYSPFRKKNFHNKTHVFLATTMQEELTIADSEQKIQTPYWWTLEQIRAKIIEWRDNTNYESLEFIVNRIDTAWKNW